MQNYPLLVKTRELIKHSHIYLAHAPKHEKYVAVKQIKNLEWQLYFLVVECLKRYHKKTTLTELDVTHEQLRCAWQLYYELGYLAYKHYRISRKRCINSFKKALKKGNDDSLESCLAHLEPSASYAYCMNLLSKSTLNHFNHIQRRLSQWQSTHTHQ